LKLDLKTKYTVIGAMSGTSLDGLDLVCVLFEKKKKWEFELLKANTYSYSPEWKKTLAELHDQTPEIIKEIEKKYVSLLANHILNFSSGLHGIDFVSSHGHTVFHQPEQGITYQIGNTSALSGLTHFPVICDFRSQDVGLGGQGAPLVPVGDLHLFNSYTACLNLGGFANVSKGYESEVNAYDICAVNTVFNLLAKEKGLAFDAEGMIAKSGKLIPELFDGLNALDFYCKKGPKSLGIEWVNKEVFPLLDQYCSSPVEDRMHTYAQHIGVQIGKNFTELEEVLITGGGAYNQYLISLLRELSDANFILPESDIIDFKEALIFAFLGVLRIENEVNCLSSVTGSSLDHSSGVIFYPQK
jgi:anhydro-N-acetylmuramic acid kinase